MDPKKIRALRDHLQMTQAEFAQRLGLGTKGAVSHWESGRKSPTGTALGALKLLAEMTYAKTKKDGKSDRRTQTCPTSCQHPARGGNLIAAGAYRVNSTKVVLGAAGQEEIDGEDLGTFQAWYPEKGWKHFEAGESAEWADYYVFLRAITTGKCTH